MVLWHHDRMIGIALDDVVVDGGITKVPIRVEIVRVGLSVIKDAESDEIPVPARPLGHVYQISREPQSEDVGSFRQFRHHCSSVFPFQQGQGAVNGFTDFAEVVQGDIGCRTDVVN